jgi:hypothetical protein
LVHKVRSGQVNFYLILFLFFCYQDTENDNFEDWFDAKEVVLNKRGQIAQIISKTFPEKNFSFPIVLTEAAVKNPQVSCLTISHFFLLIRSVQNR